MAIATTFRLERRDGTCLTREVLPQLFFHGGNKYCRNGAWPSSTIFCASCVRSRNVDDGPLPAVPRNCCFAGEKAQTAGVRTLWGP